MVMKRLEKNQALSKIATGNGHGENSPYFDGWKAYETDPYHATHNPNGVIQMGLAENQLSFDMVEKWILENPKASICTSEGVNEFRDIAIYQDYHGLPEFREAVAKFMGKVRGNRVAFDPDRIVMSGGATGAHEMIAFCLADPGEAFLVPVPYYPGFDRDLRWRTGIELRPVACDRSNDFKVTREALEEAYQRAVEDNVRVKGVLITNPSNPLGTVLDRETLKSVVSFTNDKSIHLVCDEIYAATAFGGEPGFVSVAEVLADEDLVCDPDFVHIVYSLSKDMGFPGFRVGIVYSYNDAVVSVARKMSSFGLVSTQTQRLIATMLSDETFTGEFLAQGARRLAARRARFTLGLREVGIECLEGSTAGLFLWMDLTRLLQEKSFAAELVLWRLVIHEVKLNVSPGVSFHCPEPGWFRVCIANMDDPTVETALARIEAFVSNGKEIAAEKKQKKSLRNHRSLSLSFSFKTRSRFDDYLMSSPHSPMPHSPLVQART